MLCRLLMLLLVPCLAVSIIGCGGGGDEEDTTPPVTTEPVETNAVPTMTGTWQGHVQTTHMSLFLTESASHTLHGSYESETGGRATLTSGTISGNTVAFTLTFSVPAGLVVLFNGAVNDSRTSMSGTYHYEGDAATASWDATK